MSHAPTLWDEGRQPGREVVALGVAATLTAVVLDLLVGTGIGLFFDLCFVALCVALALSVRPADFFSVGVLPPLLMVGVFVLLGISRRDVLGHPEDGTVQAVITGLSEHSVALVVGYLLCLAVLFIRQRRLSPADETRSTSLG
ncbi:DUF6542 domain-containing protein [Nocardioides sp. 503]|uniref:DUF6542 domain-containing protein n=1 Tax=Nocardioides sp. 503 TaxID=2508326 RepID=UPI00106F741E|nr:DUF6542 domain-containing protein [Nocardioides sp. 503]